MCSGVSSRSFTWAATDCSMRNCVSCILPMLSTQKWLIMVAYAHRLFLQQLISVLAEVSPQELTT